MPDWIKALAASLIRAFSILRRNDPLVLSSSTAFFTTFSLSPILVILVNILTLYFQDIVVKKALYEKIRNAMGRESAEQIESIVNNFTSIESSWWATILGFIFLLFVSTTLMNVVKHSINRLWGVRRKHLRHLRYSVVERMVAFILILITGALFVASVVLDTTVSVMHDFMEQFIPSVHMVLTDSLNKIFSVLIVTIWFTILFKLLPDARLRWIPAFTGGLVTGILFNFGKWVLGIMLQYNTVVTIFGASASFALILLFIFYSSMILYFGAAFTFAFADEIKQPVMPGKYGDRFELKVLVPDDEPPQSNG